MFMCVEHKFHLMNLNYTQADSDMCMESRELPGYMYFVTDCF